MSEGPVLRACPFCGGSAGIHDAWIFCNDCGIGFEGDPEAERRWNRRAPDSRLIALREEMRHAYEDSPPRLLQVPKWLHTIDELIQEGK